MVVLIFLLITWYTIQTQSIFGSCDSFRIGKREHGIFVLNWKIYRQRSVNKKMLYLYNIGDSIILKKILLSVPSQHPTNHTVIYEYRATKAVSCIEYQVENILENVSFYLYIVCACGAFYKVQSIWIGKCCGRHCVHRRIFARSSFWHHQHNRTRHRHVHLWLWSIQFAAQFHSDFGATIFGHRK